jgi:hypothetical protein
MGQTAESALRVGVVTIELAIPESLSLKDKRRVLKSIKDRLRARFNASVAEVGHLESRQRATLAAAMVSNDGKYLHGGLDKMVDFVRAAGAASLLSYEKQVW